jgi:hypothetical protein
MQTMNNIDTAQQDKGVIVLENDSAEQVKKAIEQVSRIISIDGNQVTFEGKRIVEGHGFELRVNCYDIYHCPNGFLLHTYMDKGSNWAVTGKTLDEMLDAAPDRSVARRAYGLLIQKNLLVGHH